ncbi:DDB1- and CUL4-associated factor 6 [Actinomortierella ambigua]|nr:DDB1- and CUL4-associated factor 6 [Actinomortierella ambigua]
MSLQEEHLMDLPSGGALPPSPSHSTRRRSSNFCRGLASLYAAPAVRHHLLQSQLLGRPGLLRRLEQQPILNGHHGCVNTIAWDDTGEFLVSGSDDLFLNIYRPLGPHPLVHRIRSGHRHNIFSAKFLTNTRASKIVSCAADGITRLTDVHRFVALSAKDEWTPYPGYNCHTEMTYEVMPDAVDSHIFYDCADDGRIHRYDIRIRTSCDCEEHEVCDRHAFINVNPNNATTRQNMFVSAFSPFRFGRQNMLGVTAITQRPENPVYIAAACSDDTVRIFDTRMVGPSSHHRDAQVYSYSPFVPSGFIVGSDGELKSGTNNDRTRLSTKITSLKYDPSESGQLLVSYSRGDCYLIQPSWMGTKEEERCLHRLSTESGSEKDRTMDKNGKRRRSSDSPEDGDSVVQPKISPRGRSLDSSKHATLRKRSSQAEKADTDKGKDRGEKRREEEDAGMEVDDTAGASSHVDKSKKHSRPGAVAERVTRAGQRRSSVRKSASDQQKDEPEATESANVDMDVDATPESAVKAEEDDKPQGQSDSDETQDQPDSSFGARLSEMARFHGWGEAVSDNSGDSLDQDEDDEESDEDEGRDGIKVAGRSAREDKVYWAKRSYRTSRKDTVQIYSGHRNARTMIKEANFYGPNSEFVMSGSDDGRIFFWDKLTGKIENTIRGDRQVVNCLQPHPLSRMLLTASGIDKTIKIFMPTASDHTDLSKVRGIRRPADKDGVRRLVSGAGTMPFAAGAASEEDSVKGDKNNKQDSSASLSGAPTTPPSPHPENELDIEHAFEAFHRDSDDGSDAPLSSGDDDDDDDDDSDDGHLLGNLQARYVLELITQLVNQRAREARQARHAPASGGQGEGQDEEHGDGHHDDDDDDDGDDDDDDDDDDEETGDDHADEVDFMAWARSRGGT